MNARAVAFPVAVLAVGAGIALLYRDGSPPAGPSGPPPVADDAADAHGAPAPVPRKDRPHKVHPVKKREVPKVERIPARVRTAEAVLVRPSVVNTPVERVHVREGDAVKKGQVLVRMLGTTFERALAAAEKAGDAEAARKAKESLAALDVVAPADGIVYRVDARDGERPLLRDGAPLPLVTLYDWKQLSWEGTAPAELADLLKAGAEVFVQTDKGPPVPAKVEKAHPADGKGGIPLEVRPLEPPERVPEKDGEARICVATGTQVVNVVVGAAVEMVEGRPTVFVVSLTGEVTPRNVVVGIATRDGYVQVSGVEVGESVAVYE
jgi:biotin carboxyl carrier protein